MEQQTPDLHIRQNYGDALLQITLDQLRTLVTVASTRSVRKAAQQLRRDQSSVDKQLKTLNEHFKEFSDEELIIRPAQRGGEVELTHAGNVVVRLAQQVLNSANDVVDELRERKHDRPLRLALTTFLLPVLLEVQDEIALDFSRHGLQFRKELMHVRSSDVQTILLPERHREGIDFSFGGFTTRHDDDTDVEDALEFLEWRRDRIVLLSNYETNQARVHVQRVRLDRWPLILPRGGVVNSFVDQVWGTSEGLNIVEWCNEVHFALELLTLGVHQAAMLSTGAIAEQALSSAPKMPLHVTELDGCEFNLRVGLFRRKVDAATYLPRHPRQLFWNKCKEIVARSGHERNTRVLDIPEINRQSRSTIKRDRSR